MFTILVFQSDTIITASGIIIERLKSILSLSSCWHYISMHVHAVGIAGQLINDTGQAGKTNHRLFSYMY